MSKARYVAVTTEGGSWWVEEMGAAGESRAVVEDRAMRAICGEQWDKAKDIHVDTQLKNLYVCSITEARRRFSRAIWAWENNPLDEGEYA